MTVSFQGTVVGIEHGSSFTDKSGRVTIRFEDADDFHKLLRFRRHLLLGPEIKLGERVTFTLEREVSDGGKR